MRDAIAAAVLGLTLAQPASQRFAGTWTADLAGKTFARLELRETGGTLGGWVSLGRVHFDPSGEITEVMQTAGELTPIFDVTLRDGTLRFSRKDGDDTDRFELRIVNGEAQLSFVLSEADRAELASQGVAAVKPVRLIRSPR